MPTEKQRAASRANGAKSRGPVTAAGKQISAKNALRNTLLARTVVLDYENRERFHELLHAFREELNPQTTIEDIMVQKLVVAHWRQLRIWGMEKSTLLHEVNQQHNLGNADPPARDAAALRSSGVSLNHFEMRFDRQFAATLRRLEQFQKSNIAKRTQQVADSMESPQISEPRISQETPPSPNVSPSTNQSEPGQLLD
jgi:hypothetical protein